MSVPFVSELAAALATIEARDGAIKKARRLCASALADPSENAIAQAAWLERHSGVTLPQPSRRNEIESNEANAWAASAGAEWGKAVAEAQRWQDEQPFSGRPAIFGGYVASTALEQFEISESMYRQGLLTNRHDATLYNNLAFALAKQDKAEDAQAVLEQGLCLELSAPQRICLTATRGLIEFRKNRPRNGRLLYQEAIRSALQHSQDLLAHLAKIHCAIEELRIGSQQAAAREREAREAVDKLRGPYRPVFREKLRRAASNWGNMRQKEEGQ